MFSSPFAFSVSQHQGLFQWVSSCIRSPKYWSFSFSISPSNEYSGLISFKIDWFDLLAVQGILKSLLQHCNSKAPILQYSAFFMVQLSHPYMPTGKNHSPPGSPVHEILQARIVEWVAIPFSRGSFWPRDQTQVSCIAGTFFTIWATREAHLHLYAISTLTRCCCGNTFQPWW